MRGWGIRLQVLLLALVPTLTISFLLVAYFTSTRIEDLEHSFRKRGEAMGLKLASISEYGILAQDQKILDNIAQETFNEPDVQGIAFYTAKGREILSNGRLSENVKLPLDTNSPIESFKMNPLVQETADSMVFMIPVVKYEPLKARGSLKKEVSKYNGQFETLVGWLKVELDIKTMRLREYQVLIHTSMILLLGLSISGLHALQMGRNVTRPILELAHAISKIKKGDLSTRVRSSVYEELQVLESGINTMAESLENAQAELQNKVDKATANLRRSLETIEEQNLELQVARQTAEVASQIKSAFLADMSHEIRTPLNAVVGFINLLKRTTLDETQLDYVTTIQKSSKILLSIINDILDFSKVEAGKLKIENQIMDIRECVEETLNLLTPHANEKSLSLMPLIYSEVPKEIYGDPLRIKQVITNLVNNAIKFTERGSVVVRVLLEKEEDTCIRLCIRVEDTGIGLTKDQQQGLFRAFHQVKNEKNKDSGGTGLGLAICKKIVEQMKGEIGLESEPNKGSTFWFTFPTEKIAEQVALKKITANTSVTGFDEPLHVLAVDDNPYNLKLIQYLLTELGIKITAVDSGQTAVDAVQNTIFHLIFMDIRMPKMNGIEATHLIRTYEQKMNRKPTPIIALTAHALVSEQETLLAAGIDGYLPKPIDEHQLHAILSKWIEQKPKIEELTHNGEIKAIDWELAKKLAGGKKDLAEELLGKLRSMLPLDLERINKAFNERNLLELRDEVHRLHGAVCYCGLPTLKRSLQILESVVAKQEKIEVIEAKLEIVNHAASEFLSEFV